MRTNKCRKTFGTPGISQKTKTSFEVLLFTHRSSSNRLTQEYLQKQPRSEFDDG